jgi:hypothetical protein
MVGVVEKAIGRARSRPAHTLVRRWNELADRGYLLHQRLMEPDAKLAQRGKLLPDRSVDDQEPRPRAYNIIVEHFDDRKA